GGGSRSAGALGARSRESHRLVPERVDMDRLCFGGPDRYPDAHADAAHSFRASRRDDPHGGRAVLTVGGSGRADYGRRRALRTAECMDDSRVVANHFQPGSVFILPIPAAPDGRRRHLVSRDWVGLYWLGQQLGALAVG